MEGALRGLVEMTAGLPRPLRQGHARSPTPTALCEARRQPASDVPQIPLDMIDRRKCNSPFRCHRIRKNDPKPDKNQEPRRPPVSSLFSSLLFAFAEII